MPRVRLPVPDPRACVQCSTVFTPRPKKWEQRCCSIECQRSMFRQAGNAPAPRARAAEKNGSRLRGTAAEHHHYVKRNGRHEHRVMMEQKLGRPLVRGEVVHHLDHDKSNNAPGNLALLSSQTDHVNEHRGDLLAARRKELRCATCGQMFDAVPPFRTCSETCPRGIARNRLRGYRAAEKASVALSAMGKGGAR